MAFIAMVALSACEDDIPEVIEELEFDRVLKPIELEITIKNQTTAIIEWGSNKAVESYVLELSDDSLEFSNIIFSTEVDPDALPYTYELPAGDTRYSVRVKGTNTTSEDSKWTEKAFKSLPENLLSNYDIVQNGIGDLTITWTPEKTVTSLLFTSESGDTEFEISSEEMAAGSKQVTGLSNAVYYIQLMNDNKARGYKNYTLEGDVVLSTGNDLTEAISAASAGDVILLSAGETFGFIGDFTIEKSIKIKGLDGEQPVVYCTEGDRMFYIGSTLGTSDSIVYENILMCGYVNNDETQGQIRGVFDMESEACNMGAVKFLGCTINNMGRQVMRLRGGSDQTIGSFVVDNCIIHDLGQSSGSYGVLCGTETNTNVTNILISNSTINNLVCHFIRYDDATACESIIVENCTFDKVPFKSGRYIMDIRNAVISEGVTVKGCIFGNTSYGDEISISGIRIADDVTLDISDTYCTSDFVNSGYSIVDYCTSLGVSSTELWADPDNCDYSISVEGVEAGDPRWIEE